jgi:hypothetical protein
MDTIVTAGVGRKHERQHHGFTPDMQQRSGLGFPSDDLSQHRALLPWIPGFT